MCPTKEKVDSAQGGPPRGGGKTTPMIQQYLSIKERYPDAILFYRMGDFYEMFFEDAVLASKILDIALTSRDKDKDSGIPMCGVPYHSASQYISKLIRHGHKVAICEQVEDPRAAKGLVKREVVRVVTPGLVLEPETLVSTENNYLVGLAGDGKTYGIAALDISTGEFRITQAADPRELLGEMERIRPKEVLIPESMEGDPHLKEALSTSRPLSLNSLADDEFRFGKASDVIRKSFPGLKIDQEPLCRMRMALAAAGAVMKYALETQAGLSHLRPPAPYTTSEHMVIDDWSRRNLELFENLQDSTKKGSLIWVIDKTLTPMGGRMLRRWLGYPLIDAKAINERLDAVEEFFEADSLRRELRGRLSKVQDLERLMGRIASGTANARDLVALRSSLIWLPAVVESLRGARSTLLKRISEKIDTLEDVAQWIGETLVDDPPQTIKDGHLIREGVDPRLDELIHISRDGKVNIAKMEEKEREKTGIPNLRIGYNRVFGYYIEVTKSHTSLVPGDYIRKQTLVNAERYINQELKEYELKVTQAEERRAALEYEIFQRLRERVASQTQRVQRAAEGIAELDCICALAETARQNRYVRPEVNQGAALVIKEGRHPVVERMYLQERFVPNDLEMDPEEVRMIILTGPNMAGKSTFLRQVALIVVMAQMGGFVPASEAIIGIVDRIFTRVGALDNLARGRSTFMVEMDETAQILRNVTPRSLIVLDEIGRGTSTFDGLSIAWAVAEYLLDLPLQGTKTLFATHYHELTDLARSKEGVKNYHIAVKEWNDRVIFLRRVVEGGTSRSYGIQVARLAGLPQQVIERAKEILYNIERGEFDEQSQPRLAGTPRRRKGHAHNPRQLNLFHLEDHWLVKELRDVDPNSLTPIDALNLLHRWKERMED
jgi:DNA mismatch repair protein MutS